jgi:dihydrofolate reductase
MRRLILQTGLSIDGYVAALDRSHPWSDTSADEAVKRWILDSVWAAGAHLMGRVTYEEMAAFWPTSTSEYARPMNEIPKVVFSKTLQHADWPETRIARGDLSDEIGRLKREPGNDLIAYGGATFDQALSRAPADGRRARTIEGFAEQSVTARVLQTALNESAVTHRPPPAPRGDRRPPPHR